MVTEPLKMLPDIDVGASVGDGLRGSNSGCEGSLETQIEMILKEQRNKDIFDRERELNIYRSGSAPPTVDGSVAAVGSLFGDGGFDFSANGVNKNSRLSEEEIRSHPAYLSYYYSNEHNNPRLPPPSLSKEDWRVAQRFQPRTSTFGGIGDRRKKERVGDGSSKSLFSLQPGQKVDGGLKRPTNAKLSRQLSTEWLEREADGLIGLAGVGMGTRTRSLADMLQEGLSRSGSFGHLSRPLSCDAFGDISDLIGIHDSRRPQLQDDLEGIGGLRSTATCTAGPSLVKVQGLGESISHSFTSVVGQSLSRSATPDGRWTGNSNGLNLPSVGGRVSMNDRKTVSPTPNVFSSGMVDDDGIAAALSGLNLSENRIIGEDMHIEPQLQQEFSDQSDFLFNKSEAGSLSMPSVGILPVTDISESNGYVTDLSYSNIASDEQIKLLKHSSSSASRFSELPISGPASLEGLDASYQNADSKLDFNAYSTSGYSIEQRVPSMRKDQLDIGDFLNGGPERLNLNLGGNFMGSGHQTSNTDLLYMQYLQRNPDYAEAASSFSSPLGQNYMGTSNMDLLGLQKAYLGALLAQQKPQYEVQFLGKSTGLNHAFYGGTDAAVRHHMTYPVSPFASPIRPSVGAGSSMRHNDRIPPMMRNTSGGMMRSWHSESGGSMEENFGSSLLDEFKNNKTRCFELSEIVGHVVEFSADQYGSRFIQQKLETASEEEKEVIFPEIISKARGLMTDVFGNYVIQKFFEHGTENQRKQLAAELTGYVLPLSLQMYGCRVIQKALEVVDVEQQSQMVSELDGSVMKSVRDQNGNHVIQKCIECVPQERIQFIISSFYGQVVALSTHPYGCRVIQRVLEHCDDPQTQSIVMEEILQSVCTLAQDQYGNYVVQHVLQHGKPHERSAIISKLAGQIVKLSQQKFASNVVEKCLTYAGPEERQLLVNEMLGTTDENEPLQAMMKDQFANYVVQKVLETCDDQSRELILSRIKVHLTALKRYTYGKHIVARVEKLVATGERRIGISSAYS